MSAPVRVDLSHQLDDRDRVAVHGLVDDVRRQSGIRPISDQLWLDLVHAGPTWRAALLARDDDRLVGYAQLSHRPGVPGSWSIELVVDPTLPPSAATQQLAEQVLTDAIDTIAAAGGGDVQWWVFDADRDGHQLDADALATAIGLRFERALYQMLVPLPLHPSSADPLVTRSFRVGADERAWLDVNNAAFAAHAEQGGWDLATLRLREREDWFDPDGFLLHERDGRLAGFCWTKLHLDLDPVIGEIYVIAVHPDFHGLGLGRALTVAGLASIAARGVTEGMLHVDQHNTAAVGLYTSLGFRVRRTDRSYRGVVEATTDHSSTRSTRSNRSEAP
ncbi:MAG: mycothiol synthase [Ilumatobacteraceae bacterium]